MSNSLSIAAVTATLRNLLTKGLQSEIPNPQNITTKPLDKARDDNAAKQVNIFLYQTQPNAALRFPKCINIGSRTGAAPCSFADSIASLWPTNNTAAFPMSARAHCCAATAGTSVARRLLNIATFCSRRSGA